MDVRRAGPDDVVVMSEWAAGEGWNPGRHDATTFYVVDPDGFVVAAEDDELIGGVSTVRWNDRFGFVGLYIVRPERRGQGIGTAVWAEATSRLASDGCVLGLDGVVEQQDTYRSLGFELAYRNLRFEGPAGAWQGESVGSVTARRASADEVAAIDRRTQPASRPDYLRNWLAQPEAHTAVLGDGAVDGYAVARPCLRGWRLGPVIAPDPAGAAALIASCVGSLPADETIVIDVPEPNRAAVKLAEQQGMTVQFETARMYDGGLPSEPDLSLLYGVTTLELG